MPGLIFPIIIIATVATITSPPSCKFYGRVIGKVQKGLSRLSIKLKHKKFIKKTRRTKQEEDCIICMDDYLENNKCSELHCGHKFHKTCILKWMNERKTCPLCNTGFVLKSGKTYGNDEEDSFYSQMEN